MFLRIVSVGVWKAIPERDLFERYLKRTQAWRVELVEIKNQPSRFLEGEKICQKLCPGEEVVIALDEQGEELSTRQFAQMLATYEAGPKKVCTFVIGGADGLDDSGGQLADRKISFGRMTWPHFLVRVLLAEQIYRVQQLRTGHPYHRG